MALNLLVVDDDSILCDSIARYASNRAHRVEQASTAVQALISARDRQPDVLITDWDLKAELDGVDVARCVSDIYPEAYIVFITGKSKTQLEIAAKNIDCYSILCKPFSLAELRDLLRQIETELNG